MAETSTALVLHGEDAEARGFNLRWDRDHPAIVSEREANMLAGAYCEGANLIACRLATALFPRVKYSREWVAFVRQHEPGYTEVRNFLAGDCNVAPLLASRVALGCTRARA